MRFDHHSQCLGLGNNIVAHDEPIGSPANVNSRRRVVLDHVLLNRIATPCHPDRFRPEIDASPGIGADLVIADEIVRVLMPDRAALAAIAP
mgnify:FL=1